MPYISEHAVRIADPDKYERYRRENDKFGAGIDVIWGITRDGKVEVQAIRFDAKRYSIEDVRKWLAEHGYRALAIEPARAEMGDIADTPDLAIPPASAPNPPVGGDSDTDDVREARLLVAGEYPDKGVAIDEATLDALAAQPTPVPVYAEHKPSLLLGWVEALWRKGKELWGKLRLYPDAKSLVSRLGVRGISVGLQRDPLALAEVSITATPRIRDAQLFADADAGDDQPALYIVQEATEMTTQTQAQTQAQDQELATPAPIAADTSKDLAASNALRAELDALRDRAERAERLAAFAQERLFVQSLDHQLDEWVRAGKLTPASRDLLRQLALALRAHMPNDTVEFSRTAGDPLSTLIAFVESLPVVPVRTQPLRYQAVSDADRSALAEELRALGFRVGELSDDTLARYLRNGGGNEL